MRDGPVTCCSGQNSTSVMANGYPSSLSAQNWRRGPHRITCGSPNTGDRIEADTRGGAHLPLHEALQLLRVPRLDEPLGVRATTTSWGDVTDAERSELRRIVLELETFPFVAKTFTPAGPGRGADASVTGGVAGAPVYWDIVGGNPETGRPVFSATRRAVRDAIKRLLQTGRRSVLSDLAADVARRRIAGDRSVRRPSLPPAAGDRADLAVRTTVRLRLPFALTSAEAVEVERLCGHVPDAAALLAVLRRALANESLGAGNHNHPQGADDAAA